VQHDVKSQSLTDVIAANCCLFRIW